ncbi:MAG TPA: hypothetical protein PLC53_04065, partial [Bacilli bacterium]|nr:hypothetical protein [Bacilli bacterium]
MIVYYDNLKEILNIDYIYLIDIDELFNGTNINTFNIDLRKYLKTFENGDAYIALVIVTNGSEYGTATIVGSDVVSLIGDPDDEYSVVVPL